MNKTLIYEDKEICLLFWEKGKCNFYGDFGTMKTVLQQNVNMVDKNSFGHPTIKPLEFVISFLEWS